MRERSTHGECSKSSWTRRTVQSRAALGFVHKGLGVMGFLVNLLKISWWFHQKGPYLRHQKPQLVFSTLFKKPIKPYTFLSTKKQVIILKHPSYRCLEIIALKVIAHSSIIHLYNHPSLSYLACGCPDVLKSKYWESVNNDL